MQFTLTMERFVQLSTEVELSASSLSEAITAGNIIAVDKANEHDWEEEWGCASDPRIVALGSETATAAVLRQRDWRAFSAFTSATLQAVDAKDALTPAGEAEYKVRLERYAIARANIRICAKSADAAIEKVCSMTRSELLNRWGDEFEVDESTLTEPRVFSAEALDDESVFAELEMSKEIYRAYSTFLRDGIESLADTRLYIAASAGGPLNEGLR